MLKSEEAFRQLQGLACCDAAPSVEMIGSIEESLYRTEMVRVLFCLSQCYLPRNANELHSRPRLLPRENRAEEMLGSREPVSVRDWKRHLGLS